ncbi:hypothetical protein [Ethanoligenens sp.]|uniref:hypothetical protein n=1 Tax=Ethanoligenens sp. TaxID=2099655 RepID=UPI0039EC6DBB
MKVKICGVLFACLGIAAVVVLFYHGTLYHIRSINGSFTVSSNGVAQIDTIDDANGIVAISGWAINKGTVYKGYNWIAGAFQNVYVNNTLVLKDNGGHIYALHTLSVVRPDINAAMNDGINYGPCGVYAKARKAALKKGISYQVGILMIDRSGRKSIIYSEKELKV